MDSIIGFLQSVWGSIVHIFTTTSWWYDEYINPPFWVASNVLLAYSAILLVLFLIAYFLIYDPGATTGGKLIFRFMVSLVGVISLSFIGIFVDPVPGRDWWSYPTDEVEWWRPILRIIIYGFVAFSITALTRLLIYRKWFPHKLKKASDIQLVRPRHTSEIEIILPEGPTDGRYDPNEFRKKNRK